MPVLTDFLYFDSEAIAGVVPELPRRRGAFGQYDRSTRLDREVQGTEAEVGPIYAHIHRVKMVVIPMPSHGRLLIGPTRQWC